MLKDALDSRQRAGASGSRKTESRRQPWFLEAERLCQVMISQGTTQAVAQPANAAERVAIERAKIILGIK